MKDRPQINGVVPALSTFRAVYLRGRLRTCRPDRAHHGRRVADGLRETPDPVAQRLPARVGGVFVVAGDSEGRLAVDEVQAGVRDDDLVVSEFEPTLKESLALFTLPLQLSVVFTGSCKNTRSYHVKGLKQDQTRIKTGLDPNKTKEYFQE